MPHLNLKLDPDFDTDHRAMFVLSVVMSVFPMNDIRSVAIRVSHLQFFFDIFVVSGRDLCASH